jgi:hypothetical protein
MATLSRLWTPAGSSGHANSIEESIIKKKSWLTYLKTIISLHLLKNFAKKTKKDKGW